MIAALLSVALAAPPSHIETPIHVFAGPTRLCGQYFALRIPAGTRVRWEGSIDFDIYHVEGRDGGWGFYEGFAPDAGGARETVSLPDGREVRRLHDGDQFSYLIRTVTSPQPYYLHIFGESLRGDATDLARLARFNTGTPAQTNCREPSRERYRLRWLRNLR